MVFCCESAKAIGLLLPDLQPAIQLVCNQAVSHQPSPKSAAPTSKEQKDRALNKKIANLGTRIFKKEKSCGGLVTKIAETTAQLESMEKDLHERRSAIAKWKQQLKSAQKELKESYDGEHLSASASGHDSHQEDEGSDAFTEDASDAIIDNELGIREEVAPFVASAENSGSAPSLALQLVRPRPGGSDQGSEGTGSRNSPRATRPRYDRSSALR